MSWTLTTSAKAVAKAGANANAAVIVDATILAGFSDDVEGEIALLTNQTWTTDILNANAEIALALSQVASSGIAMLIIQYDMEGYGSVQGQTMLDVHDQIWKRGIKKLEQKDANQPQAVAV